MCGRFTQTKSREDVLREMGGIDLPPLFHGRYNIAPAQKVAVIGQNDPRRAATCIWGFENPRAGTPIINARSETLAERPMFRDLLSGNRCLIPADGFYEWKGKQPYYFQLPDQILFAFAGLWKNNRCVIITRAADKNMHGIHDRMPVILLRDQWYQWLARPSAASCPVFDIHHTLTCRPVSRRVNAVANDDPTCLNPSDQQGELF